MTWQFSTPWQFANETKNKPRHGNSRFLAIKFNEFCILNLLLDLIKFTFLLVIFLWMFSWQILISSSWFSRIYCSFSSEKKYNDENYNNFKSPYAIGKLEIVVYIRSMISREHLLIDLGQLAVSIICYKNKMTVTPKT